MKIYEYQNKLHHIETIGGVCFIEDRYNQEMNEFGEDGWEIFQIDISIPNYEDNGDLVIIRMRREVTVIEEVSE